MTDRIDELRHHEKGDRFGLTMKETRELLDIAEGLRDASPDDIRALGWNVAVHNDYRLCDVNYTFWLFTHPSGGWVKGEGLNDTGALNQIRAALAELVVKP